MGAWMAIPGLLLADDGTDRRGRRNVRVMMSAEAIHLEAEQAPMARILDEIAARTGVRVHYAALPEQAVTATCVGETVKEVVECLAGSDADLMFRYPVGEMVTGRKRRPEELWVLRTGVRGTQAPAGVTNATAEPKEAEPLETGKLIEMATAEEPMRRVQGLSRLVAEARADEGAVRSVLEGALSDQDPSVRAQAVSGLARLGGENASVMLQQALRDKDASVRLMAVDHAGGDAQGIALLKEALADSDETVSALAAMKLEPPL